jgi:signal transduction histidine kinase
MSDPIFILLVDDERRNLDALEAILDDPAYRLLRAENADAALKLLLENDVAAIVLDIKMPIMSGLELAQVIKGTRRFRQIPILFMTAYMLDDQHVMEGYGAGAVDYLTKPFDPRVLRHKVAVFADLFRKTRALAELNETLEARVRERTAELERSEASLRAADRQKDEFLAVLAHELRNPLAPLRMGVDILLDHQTPNAPPIVGATLVRMDRQVDHMVRLIDDLLDISRITRGALELQKERVNLASVVEWAVDGARPFLDKGRNAVSVDGATDVFVVADKTRITQILGNLLHNAAKFTPEGGRIRITLAREGGNAVVRVVDEGEGIAEDQIERVFDMFARIARPGSAPGRGLGIGLALARRIAELHGGSLGAFSAGRGKGTTFTLHLPSEEAPVRPAVPNAATAKHEPARVLNILIIEDEADIADTLAMWLEGLGHRVSIARAGLAGLELVEQKLPDLVLCDLGLPEIDGVEVCRRVRSLSIDPRPMMVALTGWGREADRRRVKEAGFDLHLVKPVALDKLRSVLQRAI